MPTECSAEQFEFEGFGGRRVVAAFDGGVVTSDAGGLLLRHTDRAIGLIERVAACFRDGREQDHVIHTLPALVGQRIVGIALGYEDVNDKGLGTRHERWLALEQKNAEQAIELRAEQAAFLEKLNPCFKERHVESERAGQLLSADTFMVGTLSVGRAASITADIRSYR